MAAATGSAAMSPLARDSPPAGHGPSPSTRLDHEIQARGAKAAYDLLSKGSKGDAKLKEFAERKREERMKAEAEKDEKKRR